MEKQLDLFDLKPYTKNLRTIANYIRLYGISFRIDNIRKVSMMYGVSCNTLLNIYEGIDHEEFSYDSEN